MAPHSRLGVLLIGLGTLWILHYGPEGILWSKARTIYWLTLVVDLFFAGMLVTAGLGLRRERGWAPKLAVRSAGVVFVMSVVWLILLGPLVVPEVKASPTGKIWNVMPRILTYLVAIALCPYVVRVLLKEAPAPSRKALWVALVGSGLFGAVIMAFLLVSFR